MESCCLPWCSSTTLPSIWKVWSPRNNKNGDSVERSRNNTTVDSRISGKNKNDENSPRSMSDKGVSSLIRVPREDWLVDGEAGVAVWILAIALALGVVGLVREKNWSFKKKILSKNFMWRILLIPAVAKQLGPLRSLWPRFVAEDWPLILRGGGGGRAAPASPLGLLGLLPLLGQLLLPPSSLHVHLLQVCLYKTPHIPLPLSLWTGSWWGRLDQKLVPELHPISCGEAFWNALGKPVKKSLVNRSQQCFAILTYSGPGPGWSAALPDQDSVSHPTHPVGNFCFGRSILDGVTPPHPRGQRWWRAPWCHPPRAWATTWTQPASPSDGCLQCTSAGLVGTAETLLHWGSTLASLASASPPLPSCFRPSALQCLLQFLLSLG